uniref:Uncharacterized protein n=1 Tax=Gasterosteus aculeatus aculeatus TaxID=481459 RepID=A0AAQ4PLG0_GASAC
MGPERVLPNSKDELGGSERPADGAMLPAWSGGEEEEEEGEVGSEMELDGEEEENDGGYYYQPLNQEPEGEERAVGQEDTPPSTEQLQQRIQVSCFWPTETNSHTTSAKSPIGSNTNLPTYFSKNPEGTRFVNFIRSRIFYRTDINNTSLRSVESWVSHKQHIF